MNMKLIIVIAMSLLNIGFLSAGVMTLGEVFIKWKKNKSLWKIFIVCFNNMVLYKFYMGKPQV